MNSKTYLLFFLLAMQCVSQAKNINRKKIKKSKTKKETPFLKNIAITSRIFSVNDRIPASLVDSQWQVQNDKSWGLGLRLGYMFDTPADILRLQLGYGFQYLQTQVQNSSSIYSSRIDGKFLSWEAYSELGANLINYSPIKIWLSLTLGLRGEIYEDLELKTSRLSRKLDIDKIDTRLYGIFLELNLGMTIYQHHSFAISRTRPSDYVISYIYEF